MEGSFVEKRKEQKTRSCSEKRLVKLEKISFTLEANKLRKQYNNKNIFNQLKMKSHSQAKKVLTQISEHNIGHFLRPTKIIAVTSYKWVIYDFYSMKYVRGYRAHDEHELSVFSKLLVFCAVNTLIEKYQLDINRFQVIATEGVLRLFKKKGLLNHDDIVSLEDLLYLMIIEQSEVYETILAVNIGAFLEKKRKKEYFSVFDVKDKHIKEHLNQFYELVNSYCKLLKLQTISYIQSEPEFKKERNKGSAYDIGILSIECLKIPFFMQIIKKLEHKVTVKYVNNEGHLSSKHSQIYNKAILNKHIPYLSVCRNWEENNFLNSHCSFYYENDKCRLRPIVVVLLGCYGPQDREKDIQQVVEWYIKNAEIAEKQLQKPIINPSKVSLQNIELNKYKLIKQDFQKSIRFKTELF